MGRHETQHEPNTNKATQTAPDTNKTGQNEVIVHVNSNTTRIVNPMVYIYIELYIHV